MTTRTPEDGAPPVPRPAPRRGTAKHSELTQSLREMVGGMRPGDRLPTQEALMRQFHVSDTTVLRSLEDLKRDGLIVRRQGSGTFVADPALRVRPSAPPESVAPRRAARMVAVLSRPSASPFFSEMVQAVEANLCQHDLAPVLIVDVGQDRRVQRARAYWERGEVLGAIHIGSASLADMGDLPVILVGESEHDHDFCQVSLDNVAAGRLVGEHLWELGHRGVAVVTLSEAPTPGAPPLPVDRVRVAGLRAVWEERGGTWHEDWQVTHPFLLRPDDRHGIDMMRLYLEPLFRSPGDRPTAVFAAHDEMAIVAIRALEEMGLSVPRDVSVVGFNDSGTLAAFFRPALTTVRTPSAALATLAVHQLADLMRRPEDRPRSIRLPPEIIVRESTGPAASAAAPSTRR